MKEHNHMASVFSWGAALIDALPPTTKPEKEKKAF